MTHLLLQPDVAEKRTGEQPIPGYRLLEQLGRGGFGEVWKCEAPGGLHKAIKFVPADGDGCRQELAAFDQIKSIRHPFLLALDRVELVEKQLIMVMELADCQLHDRFRECRASGLSGIPQDELLGYMKEAAEALDMMGSKYGLQHLDVKPENIFLVAGHAKVGDYGLVRRAELAGRKADRDSGFTPKYTAPEVLLGGVDIRSDQYSLALMYAELLTGVFPYSGQAVPQLMLQHVNAAPDLSALNEAEWSVVGRALSKDPAHRYPSCLAFFRELNAAANPAIAFRIQPSADGHEGGSASDLNDTPTPTRRPPGSRLGRRIVIPDRRAADTHDEPPVDPFADLLPVMPVTLLQSPRPRTTGVGAESIAQVVESVVQVAAGRGTPLPIEPRTDGAQVVRFLSTIPGPMVPYKLVIVAERWGLSARLVDQTHIVMRREVRAEVKKGAKPLPPIGGFEVVVTLPTPPSVEITLTACVFGSPDAAFVRTANADMPTILSQIRSQLQNLEERRIHPRYPADFPILVHPLFPDGQVGDGISGRCRDISLGGVRFVTSATIDTERIFLEFPSVPAVRDRAVYVRVLRSTHESGSQGVCTVGRFPIDHG